MQQGQDGDISLPREEEDAQATSPATTVRKLSTDARSELDEGNGDLGSGKPEREADAHELTNVQEDGAFDTAERRFSEKDQEEKDEAGRHSRRSNVGHFRHDSVPPQRYHIDHPAPVSRRMADLDEELQQPRDSPTRHAGSDGSSRQVSETEDAGLDFVDVNLGSSASTAPLARSPYGAGAYAASRSAVEIRQDSISSDSAKARKLARVAEATQAKHQASKSEHSRAESLEGPERGSQQQQFQDSPEMIKRPAEGRYRGRLSQPSSRAASPSPSHSRSESMSLSIPTAASIQDGAITISFAGEDGDIETVISPSVEAAFPRLSVLGVEQEQRDEVRHADLTADRRETNRSDEAPIDGGATEVQTDEQDSVATDAAKPLPAPSNEDEVTAAAATPVEAQPAVEEDAHPHNESMSPVLTDAADKDPTSSKARRESLKKPSALEQHLSRTRMTTLPPKPKTEDVKHLHDFEAMMKQSRELELKKKQEEEERKNMRDASLQERMKVWESDILPSWTRARREARLRKLWWKGIPPNLRGRIWAMACGNSQMLPRNLFSTASSAFRERVDAGTFPVEDLQSIELDIENTLPTLRLFQKESGALHQDLKEVLCAFTMVRLDQKGAQTATRKGTDTSATGSNKENQDGSLDEDIVYPMGAASLAAMLLINLSPSETLIALINLMAERPWLRALYSLSAAAESRHSLSLPRTSRDGVPGSPLSPGRLGGSSSARRPYDSSSALAGFERVFDTLLADQMPKVYANMQARGVRPSAYVNDWIRTLFVPFLPFDAVARLWDCILLEESDALLFRTGIALVSLLSARLYVPDRDELVSILRGNNRAAIAVWTRFRTGNTDALASPSKQRTSFSANGVGRSREQSQESVATDGKEGQTTNGGSAHVPSVYAPEELVPRDDVYGGQYGITEASLFGALEEQDGWWKDSVLERLLDREIVS